MSRSASVIDFAQAKKGRLEKLPNGKSLPRLMTYSPPRRCMASPCRDCAAPQRVSHAAQGVAVQTGSRLESQWLIFALGTLRT